ncbi:MAG: T9SS type A sorting domain-containing protein [Vicingaceae bacterium]
MKTLIAIIICSLSSILDIRAQSYVPFPEKNAVWTEFEIWIDPHPKDNSTCTDIIYETNGDTIINNTRYIKLYRTMTTFIYQFSRCSNIYSILFPPSYNKLYGFYRNDTNQMKVYFWDLYSSNERLLYDYDINVNDTINQNLIQGTKKVWVDSIVNQTFSNNNRRVYYLSNKSVMIEGIGYTSGLIRQGRVADAHDHLACMQLNSVSIFSQYTGCQNIITSIQKKEEEDFINIYPNPTEGFVQLSTTAKLQTIEVYNLQGQKVQEINPQERSWELPEQSGLYLIRLQDKKGRFYTEKMVRE